jgi:hypothetical protein
MVTSSDAIRLHGAKVAAAITLLWLVGSLVLTIWLYALASSFVALPALVLIGAIAALPVSAWLGWWLGPLAIRSRKAFLRMVFWAVFLTDVELAVVASIGFAISTRHLEALLLAPLAFVLGLLIYGLPGLALAIPSAWWWEHVMRRTFPDSRTDEAGQS